MSSKWHKPPYYIDNYIETVERYHKVCLNSALDEGHNSEVILPTAQVTVVWYTLLRSLEAQSFWNELEDAR